MEYKEWTKMFFERADTLPHVIIWFYWDIIGKWLFSPFLEVVWNAALKYGKNKEKQMAIVDALDSATGQTLLISECEDFEQALNSHGYKICAIKKPEPQDDQLPF